MRRGRTCVVSLPDGVIGCWKVFQLKFQAPPLRGYAVCLVPPTGAAITYYATLAVSQVAGMALGVSCATPVLGPALGTLAVASASVAAAQVSFALNNLCTNSPHMQASFLLPGKHMLFYAIFGAVAFKVLGGRYRNLMPSDVAHPGALAHTSVPARGAKYAGNGTAEAHMIKEMYKRDGCHHCGKRGGDVVADHMPPNVSVHGRGWSKSLVNGAHRASVASKGKHPFFTENLLSWLLEGTTEVQQRYFPQCINCMKLQSASLRHGKRSLVYHLKRAFPEPPYLVGFCIGTLQLEERKEEHKLALRPKRKQP